MGCATVFENYLAKYFISTGRNRCLRLFIKNPDIFNLFNRYLSSIITDIGIFAAIFIINKFVFLFFLIEVIVIAIIERRRVNLYNEKDKIYRKKHEIR